MDKVALRKQTIAQMKALPVDKKQQADAWLIQQFLSHPAYKQAQTIATYLSMPHEVQTEQLIRQAQSDGKRVVIPKTYPQGKMIFVEYQADRLQETRFGLLEPISDFAVAKEEIDLIQVPGVVFNPAGYRIGYGAGYYDRYLEDYQGMTLSTLYGLQMGDIPVEKHDQAVKELLVENDIL